MRFSGTPLPGVVFIIAALGLLLPGCAETGPRGTDSGQSTSPVQETFPVYAFYRDIPGVTEEEIAAVEAFRRSGREFVYGVGLISECFNDSGRMGGFGIVFSQWLSDLFGLTFTPALYPWTDLLDGLERGTVDFTGDLTATPERLETYIMTGDIAQRAITLARVADSPAPKTISVIRRPRLGFLTDSVTLSRIGNVLPYEFEAARVDSAEDAFRLLRERRIDAFIKEGYEAAGQYDITEEEMSPPFYNPVSLSTRQAELAPIISVVQKYLDKGALYHLVKLYNQGHKEYLGYRFHASLTDEEAAYVKARNGGGGAVKPIPFIMESGHYPRAFYNTTENKWQGIALDVLREIELISGLRFEVVSGKDDSWPANLARLESGEGSIISDLHYTDERKGRFLKAEAPYATDDFALLSKREMPDIGINEVLYHKVGLRSGYTATELFYQWFPHHPSTVEFVREDEALDALKKGTIDLFMTTRNTLLALTNYREEPGFKANLIFQHSAADSYFGFNLSEQTLRRVIDKAQALVNTEVLESRWLSRTFDYRGQLARSRQPYLIGLCLALGIIVFLLLTLLNKYRETKHKLRVMVKRRTHELEIQRNAAETAYKVKNRFLANMSHEIRTPLNAIIGLSLTELERARPESMENLSSINRSGAALLGIINDLLVISNIESGDMELKDEAYLLPPFINSAANSARLAIGGKNIELRLEIDQNLPLKLNGDRRRIKQILGNLLSNAVKFTNEGSITLRAGIAQPDAASTQPDAAPEAPTKAQAADDIMLRFEVADTGIGIRPEHLSMLFTDYGQVDTASTRSAGGVGMGLIISKKLAELMGGTLSVTSEYGAGSVFTARLRQKVADAAALGAETAAKLMSFTWKEAQDAMFSLPYARVLVVDDVYTNHAVARGILRPYKLTVDTVMTGREAIDLIAKAEPRYDAIFMDHMMPSMDGVEAAVRIRALGTEYARDIPIIALTANAAPGVEELFFTNGFNDFMAKPINTHVLNGILRKWVRDEVKEELYADDPRDGGAGADGAPDVQVAGGGMLHSYTIEGIDLAAGAAQFGGEDNYLEIVKVFVNDTPKLLTEVQNFLNGFRIMPAAAAAALEALKNYTITVHGIKGSCYGICATQVGDLARELEMAAKSQDLGRVMELNNQFVKVTGKLVEELKALFPAKADHSKLGKKTPDAATLKKLLAAARSYNISSMLQTLEELERFDYEEKADLVRQLRQATDNYDYGEIIKLLVPDKKAKAGIVPPTASDIPAG